MLHDSFSGIGGLSRCDEGVRRGRAVGVDALHQSSNGGINVLIVLRELLIQLRVRLHVRVMDELADGLCGTAHVSASEYGGRSV